MTSFGRALSRRFLALAWLVIVSIDLLSIIALSGLRYDDGLQSAFRSDSPWYRAYADFTAQFTQSDGDAVVLFRSADFAGRADLARVAEFVLEARLLDGVADVVSIFALRAPPDAKGAGKILLPTDIPADTDLTSLLADLAGKASIGPRLISADRRLTAVIVALDKSARILTNARTTLDGIEKLAGQVVAGSTMSFAITGVPSMRQDVTDGLYDDLIILNIVGIIAGFLICTIAMRGLTLAALTTMPSATALMWSLGTLAVLGYPINVVSVALPVLILVLSFTDSLHLTFEIKRLQDSGHAPDAIVHDALRRVGPACALASLTTAIAFGGLMLSESLIIKDLGISGVIASLVSLAAVLITHPVLFATYGRFASFARLYSGKRGTPPVLFDWRALPAMAMKKPAAIAAAAAVMLVAAGLIYPTIEPSYSVQENIRSGSPTARVLDEVSHQLTPLVTIDIPVKLEKNALTGIDPHLLATIDAVQRAAEKFSSHAPVLSLASLAPPVTNQTPEQRAANLSRLIKTMPPNQRQRFVSADGHSTLVRLYTLDRGSAANRDFVGRLEEAIRADGLDGTAIGRPTGFLAMSSFVSAEMISDLNYCFLLAVVASGLLTIIWFRNVRYGLVALVPNVLPIVLIGAWLALSGRGLQFSSGVALTIAFGIAVDDTVHILNRLTLNAPPGAPFDPDAIRLSFMEVTPVLVVTTAVLSFGLAGTFVSSVPTVAYFGALSIVVFLLAILADLVVLPACLCLLHSSPSLRQTGEVL
jgi:hypothetical protein